MLSVCSSMHPFVNWMHSFIPAEKIVGGMLCLCGSKKTFCPHSVTLPCFNSTSHYLKLLCSDIGLFICLPWQGKIHKAQGIFFNLTVTTSPQKKIIMVNTGESLSCSPSFLCGYTLIHSSQEHCETGTIVFSKTVTTENLQAGQLAQIHIQTK